MSLQIKDIKCGDRFTEINGYMTAEFEATCNARRVEGREGWADGWEVEAEMLGGECNFYATGDTDCRFFVADEGSASGPYLSRMSKPNDGGPAFPRSSQGPCGDLDRAKGMSVRVWLAGQALAGYRSNPESWREDAEKVVKWSVLDADAAIKELGL